MINKDIQQELQARFNPDGSVLRRQQLIMLDILKFFDKICSDNGLTYWISSGTALGAIRHGGFIPWDDDLDVEMMYEDYIKLEAILEKDERYDFQSYKTDTFYCTPYSKLRDKHSEIIEHGRDKKYKYRGIYIDIFPVEFIPSTKVAFLCGFLRGKLLIFGSKTKTKAGEFCYKIMKKFLFSFFSMMRVLLRPFKTDKLYLSYGSGFVHEKRDIKSILPVSKIYFENYQFCAPHNLDKYLSLLYGDYNKIPNLDSLESHVTNVTFLSD